MIKWWSNNAGQIKQNVCMNDAQIMIEWWSNDAGQIKQIHHMNDAQMMIKQCLYYAQMMVCKI